MDDDFTPFENIGLCFSGGGYRATFFSFGVISYLNRITFNEKPLLEKVKAMSSVSGGTLLAVAYAKEVQSSDFDFGNFYKDFYNTFKPENDDLLKNAIKKLLSKKVWKDHSYKNQSIINAFALTYSDLCYYKGTFNQFKDLKKSNLQHVCFNATDFSFGLPFRFQNTGDFGNKPLNCTEMNKVMLETELGDVVASSSCFPMGFEPLLYPDDYYKDHNDPNYLNLKTKKDFKNGVGIMDGGITDNQGIGSMININERMRSKTNGNKKLDLIIVNDVGSFKMKPWLPDDSKNLESESLKSKIDGILKYFKVNWIYIATLLLGIALIIMNCFQFIGCTECNPLSTIGGILTGIGITLTIFGIIALVIKKIGFRWIENKINKTVPEPLLDDISALQNLNAGLVQRMVIERISSSVIMISDIFLKQMRRLNYDLFYSSEELEHKRITSTVYQLNGVKTTYNKDRAINKEIPKPSKNLHTVSSIASEMPTTLWWDATDIKLDRYNALIACGQFTTCYNLIDYIIKLEKDIPISAEVLALKKRLIKDWRQFNKDPKFMV